MKKKGMAALRLGWAVLFLIMPFGNAGAQALTPAIIAMIEQAGESGGTDVESLTDYLQGLVESPLDINYASEEELRKLLILSPFQIESLIEYRREHGCILSYAELSLVDGFNDVLVAELRPLIVLDEGTLPQAKKSTKVRSDIRVKYAVPSYACLKYKGTQSDRWQWGVTMEQDAGERAVVPDFLSGYVQLKNISRGNAFVLKSAVAGDYTVRFGQGLTVWNSFSAGGGDGVSGVMKQEMPITPYTSTDELNFFRGAGVSFSVPAARLDFSAFGSCNFVDAKSDDEYFYSLPTDGLHTTETSVAARHGMVEYAVGGKVSWHCDRVKIGVNGIGYSYSRKDGRAVKDYQTYQRYDGWHGNFSADMMVPFRRGRAFVEAAWDSGGYPAFVAGSVFKAGKSVEMAVLMRYYDYAYIAPHSKGFTASSGTYNEHGLYCGVKWNAGRRLTLSARTDFSYHPFLRYRIPAGSRNSKTVIAGEWKISPDHTFGVTGEVKWSSYSEYTRYRLRVSYLFASESGWSAGSRLECAVLGKPGFLFYQEGGYSPPSGQWGVTVRGTVFHVDEWDNRIYCYERDLTGSYSVPAAYGRGGNLYMLASWKPVKWLKVMLKCFMKIYALSPEKNGWGLRALLQFKF